MDVSLTAPACSGLVNCHRLVSTRILGLLIWNWTNLVLVELSKRTKNNDLHEYEAVVEKGA
jgi:hypothetical protein